MDEAYIAMGSNLSPEMNILRAVELLLEQFQGTGCSRFYRTKPWAGRKQPDFVNGVIRILAQGPPLDLKFDILRKIETELGRNREQDKYQDRSIDLDLILFGAQKIQLTEITLPDPEILQRNFIFLPLLEIEPTLVLPGYTRQLTQLVDTQKPTTMILMKKLTEKIEREIHAKAR